MSLHPAQQGVFICLLPMVVTVVSVLGLQLFLSATRWQCCFSSNQRPRQLPGSAGLVVFTPGALAGYSPLPSPKATISRMKLFTALLCGFSIFGGVWTDPTCDPTPATEDLAPKGTASQSSQYPYFGLPSYAINTKRNGMYGDKSCTHTNEEPNPWWRLDLGQSQAIGSVVVVNRADCCPERLKGAEVRVGDNENNNNPVCGTITDLTAGSVTTLCCKGMVGRYVSVVIPGRSSFLTLCGVEVYGVVPQKQQPSVCW